MREYRLYRLHPDTGQITGVEDILALDDEAAIGAARSAGHAVPVELWAGRHKLIRIEPLPEAAAFQPTPLHEPRA